MINKQLHFALLEWINGVGVISSPIKQFEELQDGQILFNIFKLFGEELPHTETNQNDNSPQSRYRLIFAYMEEFYHQPLKNVVNSKKIMVSCDVDEIIKVVTLLLSCAVHCNNVAIFVNCITKLDNNAQSVIKSAIEHVSDLVEHSELTSSFLDNIKVNGAMDRMTILEDEYCLSSSPREPSFMHMAYSPMLAKNFCSPHLANRQKQRKELQMERKIDTLERLLKSHKGNEVELESELNEKNKILQEKELRIKELNKQVNELNILKQQLDGIEMLQDHVDSKDGEINRLHKRLHEMENIRNAYGDLENKIANLIDEKDNLEDKLKATHCLNVENRDIKIQLDQAEIEIDELQQKMSLAESSISKLTLERNELLLAQEQTAELLKERTTQFEEQQKHLEEIAFKATNSNGGMALTLEAHERLNHLECETNQLQIQLDETKAAKEDIDHRNIQLEKQLQDMNICKETLEEKITKVNTQLDEARHNIEAKQTTITELHQQHTRNMEKINHLQDEIVQQRQVTEDYKGTIDNCHVKEQKLLVDLQQVEEELKKSTLQMSTNMTELKYQLDEVINAKSEMEEKYRHQLKQLQHKFDNKEEDNKQLASSYQQQVKELDVMCSQLKIACQQHENEKKVLQGQVNKLESQHNDIIKKHEKQLDHQQQLVASLNDKLTKNDLNHNKMLQKAEKDVILANEEIKRLQTELKKEFNDCMEQKDTVIATLKADMATVQNRLKKDNEQHQQSLKNQLTKLEQDKDSKLNQNQKQLTEYKELIDQLQTELTEKKNKHQDELDALNKLLQEQIDRFKLAEKQWLKDQQELARQLSEEVTLHERYDGEIKQAHQCANEYRLKCNQLQSDLQGNEEERCKLSTEIKKLTKNIQDERDSKSQANDRIQELEKKTTENDQVINELKSQLLLKDNNLVTLEKKATEYQDKLLQHIQEEKQSNTTTNNAILLSQSLQDLQSEYEEIRARYDELKDSHGQSYGNHHDGSKNPFNIKEDELAKLYNKIRFLVRDNDLLSQGKHVAEMKLREEQKINNRLRGQIRSLDAQLKYIQDNQSSTLQQDYNDKLKNQNSQHFVNSTKVLNTTDQSKGNTAPALHTSRIQRELNEYYSDDSLDESSFLLDRSFDSLNKSKQSNRKSITYIVNDIAAKLKDNGDVEQQDQQPQDGNDENELRATRRLASTYTRGTSKGCLHTVGSLMAVDDEPEYFDWNRLTELNLRNQQNPSHLQSSYPVELQIANNTSLTEEQIKYGNTNGTTMTGTSINNNSHQRHNSHGNQKRNATQELAHDESKRVRLRHQSKNQDDSLLSDRKGSTMLSSTSNENQAIEFRKPLIIQPDKTKSTNQSGVTTNSAKKVTRSSHRTGSVLRKQLGIFSHKSAKKVSYTATPVAASKQKQVLAERNSVV